ncbi:MAG TPA: hypothetical protein VGU71_08780 [Candidatus Dormibacteraeota bacterium]|nr:hypothetical protein [Candidatus Dormibacteraeota bacterium]
MSRSQQTLVLRPNAGCSAVAYAFLFGAPLGAVAVGLSLGALRLLDQTWTGWAIAAGAAIGFLVTGYVYLRRGSRARIVIDSADVNVVGEGGGVATMPRDSVGSIELARGSMTELQLTEGFSGEGHVYVCPRSGGQRIELSIDRYGMTDAEAMARHLGVPLVLTRAGDSRRWWWSGREWMQVADDSPAGLITESPTQAPPLTRQNLRPSTVIIVGVILGVLAIALFGPLIVSLIQSRGR